MVLAFALAGLVAPVAARAWCYEYRRCFAAEPEFRLYGSPYSVDGRAAEACAAEGEEACGCTPTGEAPPPVELDRDPFVPASAGAGERAAADRDRDLLDDRMELVLARAFAPQTVYANEWAGSFDGDPDFGEPTVLFQVRPYVHLDRYDPARYPDDAFSCLDPVPSRRLRFTASERWVRIVYLFLWDRDEGYGVAANRCRWHFGDNQSVTVLVRTAAPPGGDRADPRWWKVHAVVPLLGCERRGCGGAPFGWPVARPFWFRLAGGVHPVVFVTEGKHHWSFETSSCQPCSAVFSPYPEDLGCPWDWANPQWHSAWWTLPILGPEWDPGFPDGGGLQLPVLEGNRARELTRAFLFDPADPERFDWERRAVLGNNVGEWESPDPAFVDALDWLCLWRVRETDGGLDVEWSQVCFEDEFAWDDRPFSGGLVTGDRWTSTVPRDCDGETRLGWPNSSNRSHWITDLEDDITDLDDDGVSNADDPSPCGETP
jgi:hypothetical protein